MLRLARNDVEFASDAAQIEIFFSRRQGALRFAVPIFNSAA